MILNNFIGREKQLKDLKNIFQFQQKNNKSMLIGVDGIRKVGKTTFINYFIEKEKNENDLFFSFIGNNQLSSRENVRKSLSDIKNQYEKYCLRNSLVIDKKLFDFSKKYQTYNWKNFFLYLQEICENLQEKQKINIFIFFDEISWFDKHNKFIFYFADFWNVYGAFASKLNVFMASSVTVWSKEKAFHNNGPLFERFNSIIKLNPFSIKEIKSFILSQSKKIEDIEIIYYYFIFGGIIKYYNPEWINFNNSFEENLRNLSNNKEKILQEYNSLFQGILSENKNYKEIIQIMCGSKTLTTQEIYKKIKEKHNYKYSYQYLIEQLEELVKYSFLEKTNYKNEYFYQINHLLSYFIYYWLDNNKSKEKLFKINYLDQDFSTWKGFALEIFLRNNIDLLLEELNLSDKNIKVFLNWQAIIKKQTPDKKIKKENKAQIDLLIDTTNIEKRLNEKNKYFISMECKNYSNKNSLSISDIENIKNKNLYLEYLMEEKNKEGNPKFNINIKNIVFSIQPLNIIKEDYLNIENVSLINLIK